MIGGRSALLGAASGLGYENWSGNYSNVSLLLRGTNTPSYYLPVDESPTPKTITRAGDATVSTSIFKYGGSALAFDGAGDYITAPVGGGNLSTVDYTVEFWVYPNSIGTAQGLLSIAASTGDCILISLLANGTIQQAYGGGPVLANPAVLSAGQWYHIALVRNGDIHYLFVNGVGASNSNAQSNTGTTIAVGVNIRGSAGTPLNGYMDDVRITRGVARYVANFTPPTGELPANIDGDPSYNSVILLLRGASTPGPVIPVDESPTPKTLTVGGNATITTSIFKYGSSALTFDGTGDYFDTSATTDFDFANNPFTIEAWIYVNALASLAGIVSVMNNLSGTSLQGYVFLVDTTGYLSFRDYTNGNSVFTIQSASGLITTNTWYHVAVCKEGTGTNQVRLFINGKIVAVGTRNANIPVTTSGQPARIGAWRYPTALRPYNGVIDDLRITKGIARYTKNFLPPPAELPNV